MPLKIWSYDHNTAGNAMDIVNRVYLAVFRLHLAIYTSTFLWHPFPLPCLSKPNIVGCFGNSVKED